MTTFRWDKVGKAIARLVSTRAARDLNNITDEGKAKVKELAGEVGTYDYNEMTNIPLINNVPLKNQLSLDDLGVQAQGDYVEHSELEPYALKDELNAYATQDDLTDVALKSELEGFLTESDLVNYATKDELPDLTTLDVQAYDSAVTYQTGGWVTATVDSKKYIFESLIDNNLGNAVEDETSWKKVEFGSVASVSSPFFYGLNGYFDVAPNNVCWARETGEGFQKSLYPGLYNWILNKAIADQDKFKVAKLYTWKTADGAYAYWTSTDEPQVGTEVYGGYDPKLGNNHAHYGFVSALTETGFTFEDIYNTQRTVTLVSGVLVDNTTITDYDYVVDVQNETFRLPKKNGEENLPSGEFVENIFPQEIGTTLLTYTAPANGFVFVSGLSTSGSLLVFKNNGIVEHGGAGTVNIYNANIFCLKGDIIGVRDDTGTRTGIISYFEYAKGNGDLYHYVGKVEENDDFINVVNELPTKVNAAEAAHAAMPSDTYVDLTLPATGGIVEAPADGYLLLAQAASVGGLYSQFNSISTELVPRTNMLVQASSSFPADICTIMMPMSKGQKTYVFYNTDGTLYAFRFIYANGSKPVVDGPSGGSGGESGGSL
jgi:hypothetical protein